MGWREKVSFGSLRGHIHDRSQEKNIQLHGGADGLDEIDAFETICDLFGRVGQAQLALDVLSTDEGNAEDDPAGMRIGRCLAILGSFTR